jgi:lysophospholipase
MVHDERRLDGDEVFYRVWRGPDPRAVVVLSHGYAEHSGRYAHVAERLVGAGFVVYAPDHRGHGHSVGERGDIVSWDSVVSDLDSVVDVAVKEHPDAPVFLVGHSLGGAIAVAYALAHQDRLAGLALSAPALQVAPELLALADLPEIPALPLADAVSSDPVVVQAYKDDPLVYQGPPPRNLLLMMADAAQTLVSRLPELTVPVQVMHGSADALVPLGALRAVVSGVSSADLVAQVWSGLFHEILNEPTHGAVLDALVGWLAVRAA